ncbi:MAG: cytochrome B [Ekhidna sp.]|nr:cytochrome B [Ekhidna sp.]MBC6410719.1 cytochrome B [Ekhidna sp.]MBC6425058.1 cytochrome B [Ekhidna sp.]
MYHFLLHAHSGLRYLVLLVAVIVIIKSLIGWFGDASYSRFDKVIAPTYVGLMHLQLLLGLTLYFISPFVTFDMSDKVIRYWSVEHILMMILAVASAQVGRSISKKAEDAQVKFRIQTIFFGISILLILVALAAMPERSII